MFITFVPTGEVADTTVATPQAGPIAGPYTKMITTYNYGSDFVSDSTGAGDSTPVEGSYSSGSPLFPLGQGGAYISFYGGDSRSYPVWKFRMDDAAAVTTGMATIAAALANGDTAISLDSDGTLNS